MYPGYNKTNSFDDLLKIPYESHFKQKFFASGVYKPPIVKCFQNKSSILEFLNSEMDLINEMKQLMVNKDLACVMPYYIENSLYKERDTYPNFIMLSEKFYFPKTFSVDSERPNYNLIFLFNPKEIGSSLSKTKVKGVNSLCVWPREEEAFLDLVIQAESQIPIFYKKDIFIKASQTVFTGELAFCLQQYWRDISENLIC